MKKIYFFLAGIVIAISSFANTYTINVSNYAFSPDNFNVYVGDTIIWMRVNGTHTTTSTLVPGGALTWDAPLDQNTESFSYIIAVAGIYDYQCTPHFQMGMVGHFTALAASGIEEDEAGIHFNVTSNPVTANQLHIDFNIKKSAQFELSLNDITGRQVMLLFSALQQAGEHHYDYNVARLARGIYLLKLSSNDADIVRKVVID